MFIGYELIGKYEREGMRDVYHRRYQIIILIIFASLLMLLPKISCGQYFGRNKPHYRDFHFKLKETAHFNLYHYLLNDSVIKDFAAQSEYWYALHQKNLRDTIRFKNPIILYSNPADFQQTTVISGLLGAGTGGVTEAFKNRVVMPLMESRSATSHVLGHELVHAFQYNMMRTSDSVSIYSNEIPLWMIEGMAEYLSIGKIHSHTAMWMRDAVINDDIPSLDKLSSDSRYFPYRYGHAFWAYIGNTYGDSIIKPLFMQTAETGYESAIKQFFKITSDSLSVEWANALKNYYEPFKTEKQLTPPGRKLISEKNAGEMNVSPMISPNGKYVAFFSEKDLFSIDLFLADTESGKIIKRLTSAKLGTHMDELSFIESGGAWSPDSKEFVYIVYEKGKNYLYFVNTRTGKLIRKFTIPGVETFSNPAWSPSGEFIVVSGLKNGQSDLFLYNLQSKKVEQLTNDNYSDIHPGWIGNKQIVFASDRDEKYKLNYKFKIAVLNLPDKSIKVFKFFPGSDNLNPVFSPQDTGIYFLSNNDGFRDLYVYKPNSLKVYKLTNLFTGVSGITELSPAVSVSSNTGKIAYSYYNKRKYEIYAASIPEFQSKEVKPNNYNNAAAILPGKPEKKNGLALIKNNYRSISDTIVLKPLTYKPKFKLDYLGNTGIGIAGSRFGAGLGGGINAILGDVLGNNQVFTGIALNGRLADIAGTVAYINQQKKINFGVGISHIPYRSSDVSLLSERSKVEEDSVDVINYRLHILRVLEDQLSVFAAYAFTQTRRVELGSAYTFYTYSLERINNYYFNNYKVDEKKEKLPAPESFDFAQVNLAYVVDNSFFGIASPMRGIRSRYQIDQYFNGLNVFALLLDQRIYHFHKPLGYAFRIFHYARYNEDAASDKLSPLFLGYPTLVRGYDAYSFYDGTTEDISINRLTGTRLLVSNVEIRLPLTGPKRLAVIKSRFIFTELALFGDGGMAWQSGTNVRLIKETIEPDGSDNQDKYVPVFSTGISFRINLFGMMVIEPFYAFPLQRKSASEGVFGLNFSPGW